MARNQSAQPSNGLQWHAPLGSAIVLLGITLIGLSFSSLWRAQGGPANSIEATDAGASGEFDLTVKGLTLPPGDAFSAPEGDVGPKAAEALSRLRVQPNPAERIAIPRIGINSPVQEVALTGKEWPVPAFAVGHLAERENPG